MKITSKQFDRLAKRVEALESWQIRILHTGDAVHSKEMETMIEALIKIADGDDNPQLTASLAIKNIKNTDGDL